MCYRIDASDFLEKMNYNKSIAAGTIPNPSKVEEGIPGDIAIYEETIRNDLHIFTANYHFQDNLVLDCPEENPFLELHLNLSKSSIYYKNSFNISHEVAPMTGNLVYITPTDAVAEIQFKKGITYQTFDIHLPLAILTPYSGQNRLLDAFLTKIDQGRSAGLTDNNIKVNSRIWFAAQEIRSCTYEGLMRNMYIESKVLEILALCFEDENTDHIRLSTRDVDCIHVAASIIRDRVNNPITIRELAREIGINQTKLKIGFKSVFGTTVFGYLQELRMNNAKQYIQETELSIEEISQQCGYINISNFSTAFKKHFGLSPSSLRRSGIKVL